MANINCSEINQVLNELIIAFQDCNKIKNSDLRLLVNVIAAVSECANGGTKYDTLITEVFEPVTNQVVTYPINSFHSISVVILKGTITQNINSNIVTYPKNTTLNLEVTSLNQTPYIFTVTPGSKVVVEYLIQTV